jgi:ABC-type nitrate/sulfonate/bicarbonate transport system substrate-binding protein
MPTVRLAYRDNDRTPVIYCIKAMAERHYGVNVEVVHIEERRAFEAALFNDSCDVIIEHIEYLYPEAAKGKKITFICAPQIHRGLELVVPKDFMSLEQLRGKTMAVRDLGRPHAITLWLRKIGLEKDVQTIIVKDKEIGRWKQWKKVSRGECAACFIAPIYLPEALAAGLKKFPAPEVEIVSNFAQACLASFVSQNPAVMRHYMKAVVHALALLLYRRDEAMEIVAEEPMRLMKLTDRAELRRRVDAIAKMVRLKPYPTAEAIVNSNEIAAHEYGAGVENPLTLWDLHWLKELDDEGFIDELVATLSKRTDS